MSSRHYLLIQQDVIAKYLYEAIKKRKIQNARVNAREMSLLINIMELNIGEMLLLNQLCKYSIINLIWKSGKSRTKIVILASSVVQ